VPELTPFQTVGPFFDIALCAQECPPSAPGPRIAIEGTMRDGAGAPIPDAIVEVWQSSDAIFTRSPTNDAGRFEIETVRPGRVPGPDGQLQAPHLVLGILARGVLTRLVTRMYFDDEPSNAEDPVLDLVPSARRASLIARRVGADWFRFEIVIQGDEATETVFFDV
jgi:protocatechuate 3,4-dioxygenase, alpha subunit